MAINRSRTIAAVVGVFASSVLLAGCAELSESLAEAHTVAYTVTVTGNTSSGLKEVSYRSKKVKNTEAVEEKVTDASLEQSADGKAVWTLGDGLLNAEDTARMTVTPHPGQSVTCSIAFDGGGVAVTKSSTDGKELTCSALVPKSEQ